LNPRVALLSFLAWDPNYRIANAGSVEIVFGDMLPRMESTAPPAMGLGKHATGLTIWGKGLIRTNRMLYYQVG
jgi:hypothetical protein